MISYFQPSSFILTLSWWSCFLIHWDNRTISWQVPSSYPPTHTHLWLSTLPSLLVQDEFPKLLSVILEVWSSILPGSISYHVGDYQECKFCRSAESESLEWGLGICVSTGFSSNSHAQWSLRSSELDLLLAHLPKDVPPVFVPSFFCIVITFFSLQLVFCSHHYSKLILLMPLWQKPPRWSSNCFLFWVHN